MENNQKVIDERVSWIYSDLLNSSAIARELGISPDVFRKKQFKLISRLNSSLSFNDSEIEKLELIRSKLLSDLTP